MTTQSTMYTTVSSIQDDVALELLNCDENCGGRGSFFAIDLVRKSLLPLGVNAIEGLPSYPANTCPLPHKHWDYAHELMHELVQTGRFQQVTRYSADGQTPLSWPYVVKPDLSPETCEVIFQTVSRHPAVQEVQVQPDGTAIVTLKPVTPGHVPSLLDAIDRFYPPI